jgi:hypothetical protein
MSSENDPKQSPEKPPPPRRPYDPKRDGPLPYATGPGENPYIGPDGKPLTGAALEEAIAADAARKARGG